MTNSVILEIICLQTFLQIGNKELRLAKVENMFKVCLKVFSFALPQKYWTKVCYKMNKDSRLDFQNWYYWSFGWICVTHSVYLGKCGF